MLKTRRYTAFRHGLEAYNDRDNRYYVEYSKMRLPISVDKIVDNIIAHAMKIGAHRTEGVKRREYFVVFLHPRDGDIKTNPHFYNEDDLRHEVRRLMISHCVGKNVRLGFGFNKKEALVQGLIRKGLFIRNVIAIHIANGAYLAHSTKGKTLSIEVKKIASARPLAA